MIRHLAIVGATGAVGRELCELIGERRVPAHQVSLFASERSAGRRLEVGGKPIEVRALGEESFDRVDYAIFTAGAQRAREWAPFAVGVGAVVIDNSSAFRMDPQVPLIIPEVNGGAAKLHDGIVANPNCSTIIMNVAVWPLHRVNRVSRIVVSTYQAASGAGAAAMEELMTQTADRLSGRDVVPEAFPHPIAFNLFSHDTPVGPDGYNAEERKMIEETRKVFGDRSLSITATCVRVPVLRAH
ncbi:MAG: aspartate-semialdehyde dehydrogenase, partial [Phycisphaerae bacterium]